MVSREHLVGEWIKKKNKIKNIEISIIISLVIIMISGIIIEIISNRSMTSDANEKLNEISLVLLQIQSTLTTLTIAIIALLSGSISESYMGVSVSSYYLEKRPYIFKLKYVTVIEFVLLAISVFEHIFTKYYLVIDIFVMALIIITFSVFEIYALFRGKNITFSEIKEYVEWLIENDAKYKEIGDQYIKYWKSVVSNQSSEEFDSFFEIYIKLIIRILEQEKDINCINSISENMALFLLESESISDKIKGIRFVNDYYNKLWHWINQNPNISPDVHDQILLITHISHEWYMAVNSLDAETIEKIVDFKHLSELVIRISATIGFNYQKKTYEPDAINVIARTMGTCLNKQFSKGNIVNLKIWGNFIEDRFGYYAFAIPEKSAEYYGDCLAIKDFNICYGYLLNGQLEIIKDAFFLDGLCDIYKVEHVSYVFRTMLVHCFMYYLGFRESVNCIDSDLQKRIRDLLRDENVIRSIDKFYYLLSENSCLLSADLEEKLEKTLLKYELFPKHSNGKVMIIEDVVKEYFLYVALNAEQYSFRREMLLSMLDVNRYYTYLIDYKQDELRNRFSEISSILWREGNYNEDKKISNVDEMLQIFDSVMSELYKKNIVSKAALEQRKYEENNVEEKTKNIIKERISEKFSLLFGKLNVPIKGVRKYNRIQVLSYLDYTQSIEDDIKMAYAEYPFAEFINWIGNELLNTFDVQIVSRNGFDNDFEFREYLRTNKYKVLIGSQYIFSCKDFNEYRIHNDFINESDCIFVPAARIGIATNYGDLYIKLDDISVDISSPFPDEVEVKRNDKNGLLSYSPISGMTIDFTESELREYIHDVRKIIKVYLSVSVGVRKTGKKDSNVVIIKEDNQAGI